MLPDTVLLFSELSDTFHLANSNLHSYCEGVEI